MKKLAIALLALTLSAPLAFGALTAEEETFVGQLLNNKAKLIQLYQIADGLTNERVPVQVAQLRADIQTLVASRDAEITAVKVAAQGDIKTIEGNYETQIDAKEAEIASLLSTI